MLINPIINNFPYVKNSYSINFRRRNQLDENDNFSFLDKKHQKNLPIDDKLKTNSQNTGKLEESSSSKCKNIPPDAMRVLRYCAKQKIIVRDIWYLRTYTKPEYSIKALLEIAEEIENILYSNDKTKPEYIGLRNLLNRIYSYIDALRAQKSKTEADNKGS